MSDRERSRQKVTHSSKNTNTNKSRSRDNSSQKDQRQNQSQRNKPSPSPNRNNNNNTNAYNTQISQDSNNNTQSYYQNPIHQNQAYSLNVNSNANNNINVNLTSNRRSHERSSTDKEQKQKPYFNASMNGNMNQNPNVNTIPSINTSVNTKFYSTNIHRDSSISPFRQSVHGSQHQGQYQHQHQNQPKQQQIYSYQTFKNVDNLNELNKIIQNLQNPIKNNQIQLISSCFDRLILKNDFKAVFQTFLKMFLKASPQQILYKSFYNLLKSGKSHLQEILKKYDAIIRCIIDLICDKFQDKYKTKTHVNCNNDSNNNTWEDFLQTSIYNGTTTLKSFISLIRKTIQKQKSLAPQIIKIYFQILVSIFEQKLYPPQTEQIKQVKQIQKQEQVQISQKKEQPATKQRNKSYLMTMVLRQIQLILTKKFKYQTSIQTVLYIQQTQKLQKQIKRQHKSFQNSTISLQQQNKQTDPQILKNKIKRHNLLTLVLMFKCKILPSFYINIISEQFLKNLSKIDQKVILSDNPLVSREKTTQIQKQVQIQQPQAMYDLSISMGIFDKNTLKFELMANLEQDMNNAKQSQKSASSDYKVNHSIYHKLFYKLLLNCNFIQNIPNNQSDGQKPDKDNYEQTPSYMQIQTLHIHSHSYQKQRQIQKQRQLRKKTQNLNIENQNQKYIKENATNKSLPENTTLSIQPSQTNINKQFLNLVNGFFFLYPFRIDLNEIIVQKQYKEIKKSLLQKLIKIKRQSKHQRQSQNQIKKKKLKFGKDIDQNVLNEINQQGQHLYQQQNKDQDLNLKKEDVLKLIQPIILFSHILSKQIIVLMNMNQLITQRISEKCLLNINLNANTNITDRPSAQIGQLDKSKVQKQKQLNFNSNSSFNNFNLNTANNYKSFNEISISSLNNNMSNNRMTINSNSNNNSTSSNNNNNKNNSAFQNTKHEAKDSNASIINNKSFYQQQQEASKTSEASETSRCEQLFQFFISSENRVKKVKQLSQLTNSIINQDKMTDIQNQNNLLHQNRYFEDQQLKLTKFAFSQTRSQIKNILKINLKQRQNEQKEIIIDESYLKQPHIKTSNNNKLKNTTTLTLTQSTTSKNISTNIIISAKFTLFCYMLIKNQALLKLQQKIKEYQKIVMMKLISLQKQTTKEVEKVNINININKAMSQKQKHNQMKLQDDKDKDKKKGAPQNVALNTIKNNDHNLIKFKSQIKKAFLQLCKRLQNNLYPLLQILQQQIASFCHNYQIKQKLEQESEISMSSVKQLFQSISRKIDIRSNKTKNHLLQYYLMMNLKLQPNQAQILQFINNQVQNLANTQSQVLKNIIPKLVLSLQQQKSFNRKCSQKIQQSNIISKININIYQKLQQISKLQLKLKYLQIQTQNDQNIKKLNNNSNKMIIQKALLSKKIELYQKNIYEQISTIFTKFSESSSNNARYSRVFLQQILYELFRFSQQNQQNYQKLIHMKNLNIIKSNSEKHKVSSYIFTNMVKFLDIGQTFIASSQNISFENIPRTEKICSQILLYLNSNLDCSSKDSQFLSFQIKKLFVLFFDKLNQHSINQFIASRKLFILQCMIASNYKMKTLAEQLLKQNISMDQLKVLFLNSFMFGSKEQKKNQGQNVSQNILQQQKDFSKNHNNYSDQTVLRLYLKFLINKDRPALKYEINTLLQNAIKGNASEQQQNESNFNNNNDNDSNGLLAFRRFCEKINQI